MLWICVSMMVTVQIVVACNSGFMIAMAPELELIHSTLQTAMELNYRIK